MTTATKPPIFGTAIQGWRSAVEAISRMSALFITAVVLMLILNVITVSLSPPPKQEPSLAIQLLMYVVGIVQGFVLTPVAIATHRFVLR